MRRRATGGAAPDDTSGGAADRYAPYELDVDPAELGLEPRVVSSAAGTVVAYVSARAGDAEESAPPLSIGRATVGRATVFLHGAAGSWTTWTPLLASAREAGIEIDNPVLLDLPGWGRGSLAPGRDRRDLDMRDLNMRGLNDFCDLVAGALTQLGYHEWHLVGHSLGGLVAAHLASTRPHSVLAVGLVSCTSFSVIRAVDRPLAGLVASPAFTMLLAVMRVLAALGPVARALARIALRVGLMRLIFAPLFRHGFLVPPSLIAATVDDLRPASFLAGARAIRGYEPHTSWSAIRCPVNATQGDRDVFSTASDLAQLGAVIPQARTSVIAECGHFALSERPDATLEALGFVARRGTRDDATARDPSTGRDT